MAHEAQVRYSNLVDLKLRATLVKKVGVICNNRYEGSPKAGSIKVPVRDTEVSVNDYNKQTGAEKTHGDTAYLTVAINKDKAVNEIIDGFDAESVPGQLVADRLDSAGYSLALQADTDGSVELTTAPKRSLSAPSARRATRVRNQPHRRKDNFYPRPPRGGRRRARSCACRCDTISIHALREEGDSEMYFCGCLRPMISIHALREEGDPLPALRAAGARNFYPRPPRGGRRLCPMCQWRRSLFLSTPSARRATRPDLPRAACLVSFLSTPSARRATENIFDEIRTAAISIHALREEGDG